MTGYAVFGRAGLKCSAVAPGNAEAVWQADTPLMSVAILKMGNCGT